MIAYWCFRKRFPLRAAWTCDFGNLESMRRLPSSTWFPHPVGVVIGNGAILGEGCIICQNVTIGSKLWSGDGSHGTPILGRRVRVGAGAIILGGVKIGDDAVIGAGSLVLKDVKAGQVVYGVWR